MNLFFIFFKRRIALLNKTALCTIENGLGIDMRFLMAPSVVYVIVLLEYVNLVISEQHFATNTNKEFTPLTLAVCQSLI